MPFPTHQEAMRPILEVLKDGTPRHIGELISLVSDEYGLTPQERAQRIPSGRLTVIASRCHWAIFYMSQALVVNRVARGTYEITDRGRALLASGEKIDTKRLRSFEEFVAFQNRKKADSMIDAEDETSASSPTNEQTPDDMIQHGYQLVRSALKQELLSRISTKNPAFFERMVVDLLVAMGYGGAFGEAIQAMGQSGDGGIDGIIKEDKLGLDFVYVQAKRWQNAVHRPDVQQFVGSLMGRNASKGVFITTSTFSPGAKEYVRTVAARIVLVDGDLLADLLIDHGVGVADEQVIRIRKLDEDYFDEI